MEYKKIKDATTITRDTITENGRSSIGRVRAFVPKGPRLHSYGKKNGE